jgi:hypothetical protein
MFNPFAEISVTDAVDIGLVAVLLYTVIVWLKRSRATFVLVGIFIVGVILHRRSTARASTDVMDFPGLLRDFPADRCCDLSGGAEARVALWSLRPKSSRSLHSDTLDILVRDVG